MLQNTVRRRKLGKKNYMLHHLYLFHHEDKSNERSYNIMIASHCFPQTSQFSEKKKLFFYVIGLRSDRRFIIIFYILCTFSITKHLLVIHNNGFMFYNIQTDNFLDE